MTRSIRGGDIKHSRTCELIRTYVRSTVRPRIVESRDEVHSIGSNKVQNLGAMEVSHTSSSRRGEQDQ